jgi:carboxypeptidase C (cathepsin A)
MRSSRQKEAHLSSTTPTFFRVTMRFSTFLSATISAYGSTALASHAKLHDKRCVSECEGVVYNVFEHAATGAKMEFVIDSGICEPTPGVKQHSGYLNVGDDLKMWFWFFEARQNHATAPLTAWFNGGRGCCRMKFHSSHTQHQKYIQQV